MEYNFELLSYIITFKIEFIDSLNDIWACSWSPYRTPPVPTIDVLPGGRIGPVPEDK